MTQEQFNIGIHRIETFGVFFASLLVFCFIAHLIIRRDDGSEVFVGAIAALIFATFYGMKS